MVCGSFKMKAKSCFITVFARIIILSIKGVTIMAQWKVIDQQTGKFKFNGQNVKLADISKAELLGSSMVIGDVKESFYPFTHLAEKKLEDGIVKSIVD